MRKFLILALLTTLPSFTFGIGVGDQAPDFTLTDTNGNSHTLSNYQGKVVVISFFGYSCPICITAFPAMEQFYQTNYVSDTNVVFIGIDHWGGTQAQVVNLFQTQTGVTFPLLLNGGSTATAYIADRNYWIIDTQGVVAYVSAPHELKENDFKFTINNSLAPILAGAEVDFLNSTQVGSNVQLSWQTSSETDNQGFNVYRSENGIDFSQFASFQNGPSLVGNGTNQTTQNFTFTDTNVSPNLTYYYKISTVKTDGTEFIFENLFTLLTVLPTSISEKQNSPQNFILLENFPNPFNPTTTINYELGITNYELGKLTIFNSLGETVKEFVLQSSKGSVVWNGKDSFGQEVSSGIYFYKIEFEKVSQTKRMTLLK
ncbi:MAG: T9SS C-terminal target domain-containing protein [Calditrichaeota bacterium]|nr:MAG: T9SS C-terminal target domain-containing protein [Calditrichota bacterium]